MRLPARAIAVAVAALSFAPQRALANGRFPAANQLVVSPTTPSKLVLRTTYGLAISNDAGGSWSWVCERSVGFAGIQDPPLVITASTHIVAGLQEGLSVSPDFGCSFAFAGGAEGRSRIVDTVRHAASTASGSSEEVLALVSNLAGDAGRTNVIARSEEPFTAFDVLGVPLPSDVLPETLEVATTDARRIYASGQRGTGDTSRAFLFASRDRGTTWVEHEIAVSGSEVAYVSAVDPKNADRVYLRTLGNELSRLLVSDDGGATFVEAFRSTRPLLGFALSASGDRVYVGSSAGLYSSDTSSFVFAQTAKFSVQCLTMDGDRLYACAAESNAGFILGRSLDQGFTFTPLLKLAGLDGPLACPAGTTTRACEGEWPATRELLGGSNENDAGADAAPRTPLNDDSSIEGGAGCATNDGAKKALFAPFMLFVFAVSRRIRNRREP